MPKVLAQMFLTDRAICPHMSPSRTEFPAKVNHLQVRLAPLLFRNESLQVALGLLDALSVG